MNTLAGTALRTAGLLVVVSMCSSLGAAQDDTAKYSDDKYAFSMSAAEPWKTAPLQSVTVPGTARAVWAGKGAASIVAFVQEPGQAFSPRFLVDESAKGIKAALGAKILAQDVKTISGKQAMWLIYEGKGNGGAVTGKGEVDTIQHWVAIPREKDVVIVLMTTPSADYEANKTSFEKVVASLEVKGIQTKEQMDAK